MHRPITTLFMLMSVDGKISALQTSWTLIDGRSLVSGTELSELSVLKLMDCAVLQDSYIRLRYEVIR